MRRFNGKNLYSIAMPLGGLGTGSVALCGDGSLRQWQIHNQVNHSAYLPHSFFAVWVTAHTNPNNHVVKILQSNELYDFGDLPQPPSTSNDHEIPLECRKLLENKSCIKKIEFVGEYPLAQIKYIDQDLPIEISLEAFSPFIPLDSKNSGLPIIFFTFKFSNHSSVRQEGFLLASLQNAVGWDGVVPIKDTFCPLYGENQNLYTKIGDCHSIIMQSLKYPSDHAFFGEMALSSVEKPDSVITQWQKLDQLWQDFSSNGRLTQDLNGRASEPDQTWNGAMSIPFILEPNQTSSVSLSIAWYFPNRYINWSQEKIGCDDQESKFRLGNRYARLFSSVADVLEYVSNNFRILKEETFKAHDWLFDTTLPDPVMDIVSSQISILRTPICFLDKDGNFFGFEGGCGASTKSWISHGGCCPLNCTHVWNYEYTLAKLFPDLERTMREMEWKIQQHPTGFLLHRVLLPTHLPRPWKRTGTGPSNPALDGLLGGILKTYREYKICGEKSWLGEVWPSVKKAIKYIWDNLDPKQEGVIWGEQPNTYDVSIFGLNSFIGSLYLAALKAIQQMAVVMRDDELAINCQEIFSRGKKTIEAELWNHEYFIQKVDFKKHPKYNWGKGCLSDQLFGQWWSNLLDLGYVLDQDKIQTALKAIIRYNFKDNFSGFKQQRDFACEDDAGLLNCTWPNGERPKENAIQYSDEVWTGIEYEIAALLLHEEKIDLALKVLNAVNRRYDGARMNPWNNVECGDHYVRALSSWSLLEEASGIIYDAAQMIMKIRPVVCKDNLRVPFIARDGWGTISQYIGAEKQCVVLELKTGMLEINILELIVQKRIKQSKVSYKDDQLAYKIDFFNNKLKLEFDKTLKIKQGEKVEINFVFQ